MTVTNLIGSPDGSNWAGVVHEGTGHASATGRMAMSCSGGAELDTRVRKRHLSFELDASALLDLHLTFRPLLLPDDVTLMSKSLADVPEGSSSRSTPSGVSPVPANGSHAP